MANNVNSSSPPSSPPPGFPLKNPMVSSQVRVVVDSSIVTHHNDHLPQKINSSTHQNPFSHLSSREIDAEAKKKFIASDIVAVTEEVKTTRVFSSSPEPNLSIRHLGLPDLNDSVFNQQPDLALLHRKNLDASPDSSDHSSTESMSRRKRKLAARNKKKPPRLVQSPEGLTVISEDPNGGGVGRWGRQRTVIFEPPEEAGPSQQATASGGEEALIEVDVKWQI